MPSAPAFETAALSRGSAASGAWTIGRSIPSVSHTAVLTSHGVPAEPPGDTNQDQPGVIRNHRRRTESPAAVAHGLASQRARGGSSNRCLRTHKRSASTEGTAGPSRGSASSRRHLRPRGAQGCSDPSPGGSRSWRHAGHAFDAAGARAPVGVWQRSIRSGRFQASGRAGTIRSSQPWLVTPVSSSAHPRGDLGRLRQCESGDWGAAAAEAMAHQASQRGASEPQFVVEGNRCASHHRTRPCRRRRRAHAI